MKYAIGKVSGVFIEDNIATKCFGIRGKLARIDKKAKRGSFKDCYDRELECLKRLQGHQGFPDLNNYIDDQLIIEMENCGDILSRVWDQHDLSEYLDQAHSICDVLEQTNIRYFYATLNPAAKPFPDFPLSNLCLKDGVLSLIDFEMANPMGTRMSKEWHPDMQAFWDNFNPDKFRSWFIGSLQGIFPQQCYEREMFRRLKAGTDRSAQYKKLMAMSPREAMDSLTGFTKPSKLVRAEWEKYQTWKNQNQGVTNK